MGPADKAVAVTAAAMRMWGPDRVLFGADGEPAIQAVARAVQWAREEEEEAILRSGPRRGSKSKWGHRECQQDGRGHAPRPEGL
eukprot:7012920-Pyramimonas_sp.AAC.1